MGQGQDHLANVIVRHTATSLADGRLVCKCRSDFANERRYAEHIAEMVESMLADVIQAERTDAQLSLLAGAMRYWGPVNGRATTRSRNVYSGAQIAGWCREKGIALHRANGQQGKPPTPRGNN